MLSAGSVGIFGSIRQGVVVDVGKELRPQSITQPNLMFLQKPAPSRLRPRGESITTAGTASIIEYDPSDPQYFVKEVPPVPSRNTEFPTELLNAVCGFLSHNDLTSVARASTSCLVETRKLLYENLDLQHFSQERAGECLAVLASKRDLASIVRGFASSWLPSYVENDSPLPFLTFSLALHNMSRLTSLSLPRFDSNLLHHTTFSLERVTFLSETMSEPEQKLFSTWIASQGGLVSLSLPKLTTEITITPVVRASVVRDDAINLGNLSFPTPPTQSLVVPKLTRFEGPACLVPTLVPGRPVAEVVLHVHKTLYDGLKPSAMMASLAKSLVPVTRLSIASSPKVDARTLERLLMSAGADIGSSVRTLEVDWMLDDDILYKNLVSVISRFTELETLHLRKKAAPITPILAPSSPLKPASSLSNGTTSPGNSGFLSPPQSPFQRKRTTSYSHSLLPSPMISESESITSSIDVDSKKSLEHHYLKTWAKSCPSLKIAVFLSGAEWCVMKRRTRMSIMGIRETGAGTLQETESKTVDVVSFVRWRGEE